MAIIIDAAYHRAYRAKNKEKLNSQVKILNENKKSVVRDIKLKSGCVDCGYNSHPDALDFDHLPGYEKTLEVGILLCRAFSLENILNEISKCEVRCSNCHRVKTSKNRNRPSYVTSNQKRSDYIKKARAKRNSLVQSVKLKSGCIDCGYKEHPEALDLDHRPGEIKIAPVSVLITRFRPLAIIQMEIDKCDVRCSNCHRIKSAERRRKK